MAKTISDIKNLAKISKDSEWSIKLAKTNETVKFEFKNGFFRFAGARKPDDLEISESMFRTIKNHVTNRI